MGIERAGDAMDGDRRTVVLGGAGLVAGAALGLPAGTAAAAGAAEAERAIAAFVGDAPVGEGGPLALELPAVAENGFSVPLEVSVASPMTEADHVEAVLVVATDNPNAEIATYRFTPASGEAAVSARIRLARTQHVIAVARTSAGAAWRTARRVEVVIGGCGA